MSFDIVIMIAMQAEAEPAMKLLGLNPENPIKLCKRSSAQYVSGKYQELSIAVVYNGNCGRFGVDNVGTVAATHATLLALQQLSPKLVISAGTAGGFKSRGGAVGDVYVGQTVMNHDRRIPIPGFDEYGLFKTDMPKAQSIAEATGLKLGIVSTGNSLDYTDKCLSILNEHGVHAKEMEAAAILQVCQAMGSPLLVLKSITDLVDGGQLPQDEFLANLATATQGLATKLQVVVNHLAQQGTLDFN